MLSIAILMLFAAVARGEENGLDIEETADFDDLDAALNDDAPAPLSIPEIDWDSVPEGPEVSYDVLESPADCAQKAQDGDYVELHYTATVKETGEKFDSSYDQEKPLQLLLGERKRSIRGLDPGLQGICAGERRLITIPPGWAYGDNEVGPIPANAHLLFEVEALRVATPPTLQDEDAIGDGASFMDWVIALSVVGAPVAGYMYAKSLKKKKTKRTKGLSSAQVARLAKKVSVQKKQK